MQNSRKLQDRPFLEDIEALEMAAGGFAGLNIVDIGCGPGGLCHKLAERGAIVTGIDPNADAIKTARQNGEGNFQTSAAENTGLSNDQFDLAVFSKSLHHVDHMSEALGEAMRIVRSGGRIAVLEPQPDDPLYPVVCWIDDEIEVCEKAQVAVDELVDTSAAKRQSTFYFAGKYRVDSVADLIAEMQQVDGNRTVDGAARLKMQTAFDQVVQTDGEGRYIEHWYRLDVLVKQA